MDKCPVCGADTRPGDNYCLNCGQRLLPLTPSPSSQAQPVLGDPTLASSENWGGASGSSGSSWPNNVDPQARTMAAYEAPTYRGEQPVLAPTALATQDRIQEPARFILRSDSGEVLQEYPLDKPEIVIGRAPASDILLSKDKLTSRRHAIIHYENGTYTLIDEHSANGTFVNGQQIEEAVPIELHDGDHVGIGEHELVFHLPGSAASAVEDLPTVAVPYNPPRAEETFSTQGDPLATLPSSNEFETHSNSADQQTVYQPEADNFSVAPVASPSSPASEPTAYSPSFVQESPVREPEQYEPEVAPVEANEPEVVQSQPEVVEAPAPVQPEKTALASRTPLPSSPSYPVEPLQQSDRPSDGNVTFAHLTSIAQPALPDISPLMAALSSLDGQVMALQEQLNATQESLRNRDSEVAQTASQLRAGIRRVAERMDNTIADVARSREALAWAELLQLMEDVMNNPRDIEYVTKLARKARELNKVFQIHQNVLNTMAESNSLLRSLIGEDR